MNQLNQKEREALKKNFSELLDKFKGHPAFPNVLLQMMTVHHEKSNDYASEENPFSNIELCERGGVPAWKGVIIRLGDKYSRLLNALKGKLFNFEGVKDAFLDNANYSVIGLIEYEKEQNEKATQTKI